MSPRPLARPACVVVRVAIFTPFARIGVRFDVLDRALAGLVRTDLVDDASERCVAAHFEGQRIDALPPATRSGRVIVRLAGERR